MSSLLSSPRVKVHIGDGFKFLSENTSTYDVIITDSSDPIGPAQALFEKPYFQLLHDALAPGGSISTQGECLWLHLPLIKSLNEMTGKIFAKAEYAFTTIPTYPSGQIGFVVCSKDANRNLKEPARDVEGCKYYNKDVHRSAFVLPEFAKIMLETGKDVRPIVGDEAVEVAAKAAAGEKKKIFLLGSGFVARPCAEYVLRNPKNELTVGVYSRLGYKLLLNEALHSLPNAFYGTETNRWSSRKQGKSHLTRRQQRFRSRVHHCDLRSRHLTHPIHISRIGHQSGSQIAQEDSRGHN